MYLNYPYDLFARASKLTTEQRVELRAAWLAALRSGEYEQTRGNLHLACKDDMAAGQDQPPGFCCLGVLCDVAMKRHPELDMRWDNAPYTNERKALGGVPPAELTQAISVSLFCSIVDLMNMNDTHGMSFSEIADFIEAKINFAS